MLKKLKLNMKYVCNYTIKVSSAIFGIIAIILSFISWDDMGIDNMIVRIGILIGLILISFTSSIIYILFMKKNNTIWERGSGKITISYGDIIKIGFSKKLKHKRIIVIPVNTCFDTILDEEIPLYQSSVVSPKTIHGQWINGMDNMGILNFHIDEMVKQYIDKNNIKETETLLRTSKPKGKLLSYSRDTIIPIKGSNKVMFYLLPLSGFDENNNGQCSNVQFIESIKELITYYNKNGQGFDLYLPLMGTGLSRVGMTHQESLHKIKSILELYRDEIYGNVNIIVYDKDGDKVSILD